MKRKNFDELSYKKNLFMMYRKELSEELGVFDVAEYEYKAADNHKMPLRMAKREKRRCRMHIKKR